MSILRAISRYFRLREVARVMRLETSWWWGNGRLLQVLFDERCRLEIQRRARYRSIFELPRVTKRLDFSPKEIPTPKTGTN